ncbi:hypothetical protein Tco_0399900 [Tanacetum coccineum]
METIQAFLKEYDHIPPNEKCTALLLAEERFLKIKQVMRESRINPKLCKNCYSKLMDDLQIQQEKKETAAQGFIPYWNFSMIDDEEARDNFLKDVCTFLRKFSRIPFGATPKVILIAWERFGKIKDALTDKQYRQEDIQELMSKLLEDVRNISEELSEYINCPSWNRPTKCPFVKIFPLDALSNHSEILSDSNNDGTSSDDDSYENIEYIEASPLNLEYDNVILREKLLNISRLVTNIESLKNNPTPDRVLKFSSSFPIPVVDYDSFFEDSDTSLSHLDNSLPEFETFSDHTEETRSGSTTTHADNSLPEYDSFLFEVEPDQGGLTGIVISDNSNNPLLELPEFESFHFDLDLSFPRPPPEPPDVEISLIIKTDTPVINNFDELNEDECMYNAKISRKRSKPDNHGHGNRIEYARAGRMLSKADAILACWVSMSSLIDSICSGGGTDGGVDGEGNLDLLRDEDGKSDGGGEDDYVKSDGGDDNDGISDGSSG